MQDGAAIDDPEAESRTGDGVATDSRKRPRGAVALDIVAHWREAGASGLVFISTSEEQAEYLGANIHSLFPDYPVLVLPRWDSLPYDPAGFFGTPEDTGVVAVNVQPTSAIVMVEVGGAITRRTWCR